MTGHPVRILMISGSGREGSTNTAVLRTAAELAPAGVAAELFTGLLALPLFNPDDDREDATPHPAVLAMRTAADGGRPPGLPRARPDTSMSPLIGPRRTA